MVIMLVGNSQFISLFYIYRYTSQISGNDVTVYAILLFWPDDNTITLGAPVPSSTTVISMLGYSGNFDWKPYDGGIQVTIPTISINELPCNDAWVLKLEGLAQQ